MKQLALVAAAALLTAPNSAASKVWVVDVVGGAGVDFTDIQPAVAAAVDGDTILVASGQYGGFTVDAKSLDVVADLGAFVLVPFDQILVRNVAPTQRVLLRGIQSTGPPITGGMPPEHLSALRISGCAGSVWIDDCDFTAASSLLQNGLAPGIAVEDSDFVTVTTTVARGSVIALGGLDDPHLASGLFARSSTVHVYDSELVGAWGAGGGTGVVEVPGFHAGAGLALDGGFALASGSILRGGTGGDGSNGAGFQWCGAGGHGGHGLWLLGDASSTARLVGTTLVGGLGGEGGQHIDGTPVCSDGADGLPSVVGSNSLVEYPGPAPGLGAESPVREGLTSFLTVSGGAGDLYFLFASAGPFALDLPELFGTLLIAPPWFELTSGSLPGGGTVSVPLVAPSVPPTVDARTFFLQTVAFSGALGLQLGAPTSLTVLAAGF